MTTVQVKLAPRSYAIQIGTDLLDKSCQLLSELDLHGKILIISNKKVWHLYGRQLRDNLAKHYSVFTCLIGDGERYKSYGELQKILRFLIKNKFERLDTIAALGGGIVGDLAGFAAAIFLRGINFVQIPTTLLAQVDSSVGGKTAINDPLGKNLIGAFYQPKLVIADTRTLRTLSARELRCGLGEIVKYGLIAEPKILAALAQKPSINAELIAQCCRRKAKIVSADERENGLRAILNFGHTIGHALETVSRYRISHGEAIALGALGALHISISRGYLPVQTLAQTQKLYLKLGLPTHTGQRLNHDQIYQIMQSDKKVADSRLRMVLLRAIGKPVLCPVEYDEVVKALAII
ncbi:3-dehydroquinate synthetase [Candidatus Termititenax persephonae]|uniref:3-dehydroquinate synthase n=1 Tax=Candidatus Termititenax persephonae TaxID=2218525 RepID=A0A388TGQ4_9BACT|nr:3-dehydroquinate synthetase [Candidatus Termititenax persephonae]